jgi:arsenate reductase
VHCGFDDPPRLAEEALDEECALNYNRRVRNEIKAFIDDLQNQLNR